jgi:hypothetical protein
MRWVVGLAHDARPAQLRRIAEPKCDSNQSEAEKSALFSGTAAQVYRLRIM